MKSHMSSEMWLLLSGLIFPLVLSLDVPPTSKALQPEDHDLLFRGNSLKKRMVRAHGVVQDEVGEIPGLVEAQQNDDYSDFSKEPLRNGGANHLLKKVSYVPIPKKYEIPSPEPETDITPSSGNVKLATVVPGGQLRQIQQTQLVVYQQPQARKGYFYYHYPYQQLPRQYLLRPRYAYTYPPQYQNVAYTYHHPLPYKDHYSIYRNDYRFNPYAASYGGCAGATPCGGYAGGYSGCGAAGGCGGGCSSGDGCGYDDNDQEGEDSEEEEGGRSGEARINKKDPLEDLDLEDLEKLGEATSGEKRKPERRNRRLQRAVRR